MTRRAIIASFAATILVTAVGGCSNAPVQTAYGPMPEYCTQNNTATGAIIGTLLGAGLGAAIGGGRGAAIGAASGLALGGVTGAQADQQCHQIALERVVEIAAAQQAAAQQAAAQQAAYRPQPQRNEVAFESVEYVSPSNGHRHRVTPKNSYKNPATKETCSAYDAVEYDANGQISASASGRACIGADGKMHEA